MSKSASKKGSKETPTDGSNIASSLLAEFLSPPPTLIQLQTKIKAKRAAIAAEAKLDCEEDLEIEPSFKGADALEITPECALDFVKQVKTLEEADKQEALSIIRAWFNLCPPLHPPQSLLLCPSPDTADLEAYADSEVEDIVARDTALAEMLFDAAVVAVEWGFSVGQVCWFVTLLEAVHRIYLERGAGGRAAAVQVLTEQMKGMVDGTGEPWNACVPRVRMFDALEIRRIIEWFSDIYLQHVRLITYFFTRPREVDTTVVNSQIDSFVEPSPLSGGILAEKWGDYLLAEAEKVRRAKELELEAIAAAKREVEEKERKAKEDAQIAEMVRVRRMNMVITVPPLEPFPKLEVTEVVKAEVLFPVASEEEEEGVVVLRPPEKKEYPGYHPEETFTVTGEDSINVEEDMHQNVVVPPVEGLTVIAPQAVASTRGSVAIPRPSAVGAPIPIQPAPVALPQLPIKIVDDTPLNPPNLQTLLSTNTANVVSTIITHLEKKIEYQSTEIGNRFTKVCADRIAMKKYEKEEEDKITAMQQGRLAAGGGMLGASNASLAAPRSRAGSKILSRAGSAAPAKKSPAKKK
ncbi:hypothetical protein BCR33DRAFT_447550 [Rhizoclosmatium globosum]|uniref:Uncharacterized protein n=1 Tax=Rhizoclosmatium globosum TaxID=329046 RepID=A0A1Y2BSB4_9FUNG|nr:hypothetical protein BCR33DRAFT_447550 [Rhizoclosmatium globosum]|eukprot:ORY37604.1 hypothetical protein BCR33DRAFT_447550 [Rhizoclosmatium globosum]